MFETTVADNDKDIFLVNTFCQGYSQATAIGKSISMFSYAFSQINSARLETFCGVSKRNTTIQPFVSLDSALIFLRFTCATHEATEILPQDIDQWMIMFEALERYQ